MAGDLTTDAPIRILGEGVTEKFTIDTAANRTFYKGQPVMVDQNVDNTGNVVQFVDAMTVATTDVFMGIAAEGKTVVSGDPETTEIECYVEPTIVGFKSSVFTAGVDNGKAVFLTGSGTLAGVASASGNPQIGTVFCVKDGYCYVRLVSPFICVNAT